MCCTMDAALEKSCLEGISHTVIDSNAKISVRSISNNYGLNFADAVKILQKWIDANGKKNKLSKEFIVRGIDGRESSKGCPFITLADERKLKSIQTKANDVTSVLYSVEVASESGRRITVPDEQDFRMINLPLKTEKRDVKVFTPAETSAVVKQETKPKVNYLFGSSSSTSSKAPIKSEPKPTASEVKQSSPTKSAPVTKSSSPQKSPSKNSPGKKSNNKKPVSGKASIASFFSNQPTKAAKSSTASAPEVKTEKVSPKVEPKVETPSSVEKKKSEESEQPRWKRMISDESEGDDDVVPSTPQEKKEPKKRGPANKKVATAKKVAAKNANPSKKSRIMQIEDSSEEEEDDEDKKMRDREERQVKLELSEDEDVEMKTTNGAANVDLSPEKPVENDANHNNKKRIRVKKEVTRTFMDEEGYLTTEKTFEMVSASEDEADDTTSKTSGGGKKAGSDSAAETKGKVDSKEKKTASKVTPPTPKTKQGSIMSFFSKK
ncbi:DNA polymerase delta subunit 3-like [Uranotaenia lowii]|uniref:DNA polymerase delta subunit 3-like n=1 Tax=Uranotaenia lowii TaxID=190385 RepID=UPI00247A5D7B|nr:DNA polymerase delta subunit 3-like [Uranotaenia lowii]